MLFSLAIAHVLKPTQRERTIQEGIELGKEYGFEAATSGVSLAETGRAVQFFHGQLLQTLLDQDTITIQDVDDLRIRRLIDHFSMKCSMPYWTGLNRRNSELGLLLSKSYTQQGDSSSCDVTGTSCPFPSLRTGCPCYRIASMPCRVYVKA